MIWIKMDVPVLGHYSEKLFGYVPQLDKRYSEEEIRALNEHQIYQGWTNLAELVMMIQGYSYTDGESHRFPAKVTSIADIEFDFDFECFWITQGYNVEQYIKDIHEVFTHLKLYQVKEHLVLGKNEELKNIIQSWRYLITKETTDMINDDYQWKLEKATEAAENLKNLEKRFAELNLDMPDIFCDKVPDILSKTMDEERTAINTLNIKF